jgi:hypothetical protein
MIPARMGTLERSRGRIEHAIAELGYATWYDPAGTFVASNLRRTPRWPAT